MKQTTGTTTLQKDHHLLFFWDADHPCSPLDNLTHAAHQRIVAYKDSLDTRAETDFIVSVHSRLTNCHGKTHTAWKANVLATYHGRHYWYFSGSIEAIEHTAEGTHPAMFARAKPWLRSGLQSQRNVPLFVQHLKTKRRTWGTEM